MSNKIAIMGGIYDAEEKTLAYPGFPTIGIVDAENIALMTAIAKNLEPLREKCGTYSQFEIASFLSKAVVLTQSKYEDLVREEAEKLRHEEAIGFQVRTSLEEEGLPFNQGIVHFVEKINKQMGLERLLEFDDRSEQEEPKRLYGYPIVSRRRASASGEEDIATCHYRGDIFFDVNPDGSGHFFSSAGVRDAFDDYDGFRRVLNGTNVGVSETANGLMAANFAD